MIINNQYTPHYQYIPVKGNVVDIDNKKANQASVEAPKYVKMTEEAQQLVEDKTRSKFKVVNDGKGPIVQVLDKNSDEVLLQIPSEQLIKESSRFRDYLTKVKDDMQLFMGVDIRV